MQARLNTDALRWAITRSGDDVAALRKRWPRIDQWLDGSKLPTVKQLEDFANRMHVSIDLLFREGTPTLPLQIADYRTLDGRRSEPSPELYDTVSQMQFRQDWLRDYFIGMDTAEVEIVGMLADSPTVDVEGAACAIRSFLDIKGDWAFSERDEASAVKELRDKVEAKRVSVVINGIVGDNTHRRLDVAEFRGFVLSDRFAPIVFVNGQDAKCAQLFTLAHELAHLALDRSGVVQPDEQARLGRDAERLCDAIAAEILVPKALFASVWDANRACFDNVERVRKLFKVSFMVCARKALELGLIDGDSFAAAVAKHNDMVKPVTKAKKNGGDYYRTKAYRVGNVFGEAVFVAVQTRQITHREACRLTGLSTKTFSEYFKGYAA